MDGVSALAFVSSVLAVIDFSAKVLSQSHKIYTSGSTKEHAEMHLVAKDLSELSQEVKSSSTRLSHNQVQNNQVVITMTLNKVWSVLLTREYSSNLSNSQMPPPTSLTNLFGCSNAPNQTASQKSGRAPAKHS